MRDEARIGVEDAGAEPKPAIACRATRPAARAAADELRGLDGQPGIGADENRAARAEPAAAARIGAANTESGTETAVTAKVLHRRPATAAAKTALAGIPAATAAEPGESA